MATHSGVNAASGTLTASTVDTVILTAPTLHGVRVVNTTAGNPIFFTVCTVGGPNAQPAVNGANCYVASSVGTCSGSAPIISTNGMVVNLISAGTPAYTVEII